MHKREPDFIDVPPIVPGQQIFSPDQFRLLLGGISLATYYKLRNEGAIKFSRLERGASVVHTLEQYEDYVRYLNTKGEVKGYGNRNNGSTSRQGRDARQ